VKVDILVLKSPLQPKADVSFLPFESSFSELATGLGFSCNEHKSRDNQTRSERNLQTAGLLRIEQIGKKEDQVSLAQQQKDQLCRDYR